jgi:hypothetical protein
MLDVLTRGWMKSDGLCTTCGQDRYSDSLLQLYIAPSSVYYKFLIVLASPRPISPTASLICSHLRLTQLLSVPFL